MVARHVWVRVACKASGTTRHAKQGARVWALARICSVSATASASDRQKMTVAFMAAATGEPRPCLHPTQGALFGQGRLSVLATLEARDACALSTRCRVLMGMETCAWSDPPNQTQTSRAVCHMPSPRHCERASHRDNPLSSFLPPPLTNTSVFGRRGGGGRRQRQHHSSATRPRVRPAAHARTALGGDIVQRPDGGEHAQQVSAQDGVVHAKGDACAVAVQAVVNLGKKDA